MEKKKIKAICDTSALFSGRQRRYLLLAARENLYIPYWSPWIIGELYRVLTWDWIEKRQREKLYWTIKGVQKAVKR